MAKLNISGGVAKKKNCSIETLPAQTTFNSSYGVESETATISYYIDRLPEEQKKYLKEYVLVVNENHIPKNPRDGKSYKISKEVQNG